VTDFNKKTQIQTPTESYRMRYPKIVEYAEKQLEDQLWFHSEMKLELDRMQLVYELSPEQKHAVLETLGIFLQYELIVGEEFWMGVVAKEFPVPEVVRAASIVAMVELAIHSPFYDKMKVVLGLDKDEDYVAYKTNPVLAERVSWLRDVLTNDDRVTSTLIFGLTECVLLFSSFAILKSFQSNGCNMIPVTVRGTNQSAVDEDLHSIIIAEIINTRYAEIGEPLLHDKKRYKILLEATHHAITHEDALIENAIPGESLNGVPKEHFKQYVRHRANIYHNRLGLPDVYEIGECSITDWFESNTVAYKVIDFFTPGLGQEYQSGWNKQLLGSAWKGNEVV
jgi:ribonucleotide reductase beta subunit family protein with ferritin-like domain